MGFALIDFEGVGLGVAAQADLDAALRILRQMDPLPLLEEPDEPAVG